MNKKTLMKRLVIICPLLLFFLLAFDQQKENADKKEIKGILTTFMNCISNKDSLKFYALFHDEPVVWVGVFKEKSQLSRLKKDSTLNNFFSGNFKKFYRSISNIPDAEEKFYNVSIVADENVASVTFDYSFWQKKEKTNWGKESWGLVNVNGRWKITSVIFSIEYEKIYPEPEEIKKEDSLK